jgi:hypothetical protein
MKKAEPKLLQFPNESALGNGKASRYCVLEVVSVSVSILDFILSPMLYYLSPRTLSVSGKPTDLKVLFSP